MGCVSLEPWDSVWRRNQHFAHQLVSQGLVREVRFVEPPVLGSPPRRAAPEPGIKVLRPALVMPKRYAGLGLTGAALQAGFLRSIDALWVNDPQLGRHCLSATPSLYDVTDDWRAFPQPQHVVDRIVRAEDVLALRASTVVCSQVLADRWQARYGLQAAIVQNGVDVDAFARAEPVCLQGASPHLGYIGTLHSSRLDIELLLRLADLGTVHLVGPIDLDKATRARLKAAPHLLMHGPVPAGDVPGWMLAMDVLLCPHLINDFTLSLDAIKAHEYAAAGRPVVATPTSGYQSEPPKGAEVVAAQDFPAAVARALHRTVAPVNPSSWAERAQAFAEQLLAL